MNEDLAKLVAIAIFDRRLQKLDTAIKRQEKRLADASAHERGVQAQLDTLQARLGTLKKEEHALQRKLHLYRDRRSSAARVLQSGVGDFSAAERQLAQCDEILDETETLLLEALETHDGLDSDIEACSAALEDAQQGLSTVRAETQAQIGEHNTEWQQIVAEREVGWAALDREFHGKYETLLRRKKYAVAPIYQGACTGCQRVIQRQEAADVKRGLLKTCRGCHRWIVLETDWPLPLGV